MCTINDARFDVADVTGNSATGHRSRFWTILYRHISVWHRAAEHTVLLLVLPSLFSWSTRRVQSLSHPSFSGQYTHNSSKIKWKKRSEETQTLHAGCSKAEPKIFTPLQTPFPGVQDSQNLINWRWSLPLHTNPVCEDWCTQFRVIVVTDPQTNKHTNR